MPQPVTRKRRCPTCAKLYTFASVESFAPYPFCSERCRLIDLGSWLNEEYQIAKPIEDGTDRDLAIEAFADEQP